MTGSMTMQRRLAGLAVLCGLALWPGAELRAAGGTLELTVLDDDSGQPIACRMHLVQPNGRPRRVTGLPFWHDHFVIPGRVRLKLPRGQYKFQLERGPEYVRIQGHFTINDGAQDAKVERLRRLVHMAEEGWWSGDLHVHRPLDEIERLMQADDLHVAPVITWWNDRNQWRDRPLPADPVVAFDESRYYDALAGEDERGGGALLFFRLRRPLDLSGATREYPSGLKFLREAKSAGGWVDAEKPFWWDLPLWLASGGVDSIGLANNHLCRSEVLDNEAWGRPRDRQALPGPWGNGQWSESIYHRVLECGLRIPPSAGSASGVLPNPVGYNRAYVYTGRELDYDEWWTALAAGRVVVTNGPLLRPLVEGRRPGHVFQSPAGAPLDLEISLSLTARDPVSYLEIVQNGQVVRSVRLDEQTSPSALEPLKFRESGWFLIRVVCDVPETYRFASTGPYYVEIGADSRRISRQAVQFFLDWLDERQAQLALDDPDQRAALLGEFDAARKFWVERLKSANAP